MIPTLPELLVFDREAFLQTRRSENLDRRKPTSLYVIQSEKYCKVGIASNVTKRLENFRAGNPHPIRLVRAYPYASCMHALLVERTVHKVLARYSVGREWFCVDAKTAQLAASAVSSAMRGFWLVHGRASKPRRTESGSGNITMTQPIAQQLRNRGRIGSSTNTEALERAKRLMRFGTSGAMRMQT